MIAKINLFRLRDETNFYIKFQDDIDFVTCF